VSQKKQVSGNKRWQWRWKTTIAEAATVTYRSNIGTEVGGMSATLSVRAFKSWRMMLCTSFKKVTQLPDWTMSQSF